MATQVIGAVRRSRIGVTLLAVALTLAVAVVVAQASSIWSNGTVAPVRPAPVEVSWSAHQLKQLSAGTSLPRGCRIKYGCTLASGTTGGQP